MISFIFLSKTIVVYSLLPASLFCSRVVETSRRHRTIDLRLPSIIQKCQDFRDLVGKAGDLYLIHPYMLHASSANHSSRPRVMSNPPVVLKEPLRLDRKQANLSLLEETTLRFLETDFIPPPKSARAAYWVEVA